MKQLKRLIAVYDETIVVKGHHFRVETSKEIMQNRDNSIYELYDSEKHDYLIAGTIRTYTGLHEIAEAYVKGDKQALEKAKGKNCICNL